MNSVEYLLHKIIIDKGGDGETENVAALSLNQFCVMTKY